MAIILLSGERGAGKTTALQALLAACREAGRRPGGTLQPGIFDAGGVKVGSTWVEIARDESGELASTLRDLGGPAWKRWSFSEAGLRAANQAVILALETGLDPVLVDEIGPLELRLGQGLSQALAALLRAAPRFAEPQPATTTPKALDSPAAGPCRTLVIAVRDELADELGRLFPGHRIMHIGAENRAAALDSLRTALGLPRT